MEFCFGSGSIHLDFRVPALPRSLYSMNNRGGWVMKRQPIVVVLAVAMRAVVLGGCTKLAPYERGMLAHPTMTPEEISIGLDGHVRAVSEGAAGGLGGGGGGCGCN